jgi:hypothetical protein
MPPADLQPPTQTPGEAAGAGVVERLGDDVGQHHIHDLPHQVGAAVEIAMELVQ